MKRCPECGRTFTNSTLTYCLNDGAALTEDNPQPPPYYGSSEPPPFYGASAPPPTYTEPPPPAAPPPAAGMPLPAFSVSAKSSYSVTPQGSFSGVPGRKIPWRRLLSLALLAAFAARTWLHHTQTQAQQAQTQQTQAQQAQNPPMQSQPMQGQWNTAPNSRLRLSLMNAVKNADAAEAGATSSLDSTPLSSTYTGPALAQELKRVQDLQNTGRTAEERLLSENFTAFKVSADQSEARVDVTETWSNFIYSAPSHQKISSSPSRVTPQTIFLKRTPNGWLVENIVFYPS